MSRKTLLERLDDSVAWMGINKWVKGDIEHHPIRYWPIIMLIIATIGLFIILDTQFLLGISIIFLAFFGSVFLPIFGPIKPWGTPDIVDEFDQNLRAKSYSVTLPVIMIVAILVLFFLPIWALFQGWDMLQLQLAMMSIGFYIAIIWSCVPTLYASWNIPVPPEGDEA